MDFSLTERTEGLREQLVAFMDEHVYAAEPIYLEQLAGVDDHHTSPPVLRELQKLAQEQGLWNLFLPDDHFGAGLSNAEYAPLAEVMGRSLIGAEVFNCSAPDTGNMELLVEYGNDEQQALWLKPLLEAEIRSCFGMTEPGVGSSDPTNISTKIEREGDELIVTGRKWWTTGAASTDCKLCIVMGVSESDANPRGRYSMVLVPLDAPGVEIKRTLPVFGYDLGHGGHCEISFDGVRVPSDSFLGTAGEGFQMAQARLGPGRIHHCMRLIGMAERSLELLCRRALERETFGKALAKQGVVREWIADSRVEISQARLAVLHAATTMDQQGNQAARGEISEIKVSVPEMACRVIDRAIQAFGGEGVSDDVPLAAMYAAARTLRIADGPDEVHKLSIARRELARYIPGG